MVCQQPASAVLDNHRAGTSDLFRYLVVSMPVDGITLPIVGIGDFFIISAICFALIGFGRDRPQLVLVPLLGLILAIDVSEDEERAAASLSGHHRCPGASAQAASF
jgi:hypothetical protein